MSMKKWRQLVNEKAEVEQQNESILAAIKNNKINEELGQLSGEKLFKPITSRLDTRVGVPHRGAGTRLRYGRVRFKSTPSTKISDRMRKRQPQHPHHTPPHITNTTTITTSTPPPSPTWGEPHIPRINTVTTFG